MAENVHLSTFLCSHLMKFVHDIHSPLVDLPFVFIYHLLSRLPLSEA